MDGFSESPVETSARICHEHDVSFVDRSIDVEKTGLGLNMRADFDARFLLGPLGVDDRDGFRSCPLENAHLARS
ncbi:MAG: hypothetical protein ACJ757_12895 [Gaiellaceae bacterium]